jgi:PhnB protein
MAMTLNPYLHFDGNAEEALHFYSKVFGTEGTVSRYGDDEEAMKHTPAEFKDKIMHAELPVGDMRLFLSDSGPMGSPTKGSDVSLALSGTQADADKLNEYFVKLCEGGKVDVPLTKASWGDTFGMLHDKYGFGWFVNISAE